MTVHGVLPHRQLQPRRSRRSRAPASCCARRSTATTPNGRRCARRAAIFSTPWEPIWPADDLTRGAFRRRLKRYAEDQRTDLAYAFLIFRSDDNALVGGLTLANIRRGVAQAGSIGYWVGAPFARKGYMTAAVRALIPYRFGTLRLHRLEAACIPGNAASVGLLEKTGFTARGLCARLSLHQRRSGRTICSMPGLQDDPVSGCRLLGPCLGLATLGLL